jgi:hypothetical protein
MFDHLMSPDLPNQWHAELIQIRAQERLARRVARERKAARVAARRSSRRSFRRKPIASADAKITCPAAVR